jgi:hypothetical protein
MKKLVVIAFALMTVPLLLAGVARADSITASCPNDAATTCTFTLEYSNLTDLGNGTSDVTITLTIDTANTASLTDYITDVAFKAVSNDDDINGVPILTTAPGGPGAWTVSINELTANGCAGAANPGEVCAADSNTAPLDGSNWSWVFEMNIDTGSLLLDPLAASIKALYCDGGTSCGPTSGNFLGLTSEHITLQQQEEGGGQFEVQAPTGIMLMGTALLGLGAVSRLRRPRRRK